MDIEARALRDGGYIEAIINLCEEKGIYDFEDVVELLHPILLEKVKTEFKAKKFLSRDKIENSLKDFFE